VDTHIASAAAAAAAATVAARAASSSSSSSSIIHIRSKILRSTLSQYIIIKCSEERNGSF
jgi:hypothetical protein